MPFSLEFQPTVTDIHQVSYARHSGISLIVRRLLAAVLIVYGVQHLYEDGFDWVTAFLVLVAIMFAIPFYVFYLFFWGYFAIWKPVFQVTIDHDCVCQKVKNHTQEIPWSSFVNFGSAAEYKHHFWLEGGRGSIWIPKRLFRTDAEMDAFRQFVAEKMGERCQFATRPIS